MHQNIDGLLNKSDILTVNLDIINKNNLIDILCITEHNMTNDDSRHLHIPNFNLVSSFSRKNRYGGCGILVRNNLKCKSLPEVNKFSVPKIIECCAVELVEHKIILICIYRSPKYNKEDVD